uniref:C2H2-type domain-containing protein n=1 Tax=Syphacia muris TaxID=451379 RepID=A0A0N5B030_9BILA
MTDPKTEHFTNIFECSLCPQVLFSTPEELCQHMKQYHDMRDMEVQSIFFSDKMTFQHWLKTVEDGRGQPGGYVQGAQNPFSQTLNFEDEYYLLCKKKYCTLKRRRLSEEQKRDSNIQHIVCAAFVHVTESSNGSVWVRYCLEHCGHPLRLRPVTGSDTAKQRAGPLKRNCSSTTADSEDEDYESEEAVEETFAPVDEHITSLPIWEGDMVWKMKYLIVGKCCSWIIAVLLCLNVSSLLLFGFVWFLVLKSSSTKAELSEEVKAEISTHRRALLCSVESELASAKASVCSIKEVVSEKAPADVYAKLCNMAKQLRTVTQVLSDLAVDVSPSNTNGIVPMDI